MRLTFEWFDGRSFNQVSVIDEDTGKEVGHIQSDGVGPDRSGGIGVNLFNGKYVISVRKYDQCWGFVKGVEAVLQKVSALTEITVNAGAKMYWLAGAKIHQ